MAMLVNARNSSGVTGMSIISPFGLVLLLSFLNVIRHARRIA
jgi:hypothetical protein